MQRSQLDQLLSEATSYSTKDRAGHALAAIALMVQEARKKYDIVLFTDEGYGEKILHNYRSAQLPTGKVEIDKMRYTVIATETRFETQPDERVIEERWVYVEPQVAVIGQPAPVSTLQDLHRKYSTISFHALEKMSEKLLATGDEVPAGYAYAGWKYSDGEGWGYPILILHFAKWEIAGWDQVVPVAEIATEELTEAKIKQVSEDYLFIESVALDRVIAGDYHAPVYHLYTGWHWDDSVTKLFPCVVLEFANGHGNIWTHAIDATAFEQPKPKPEPEYISAIDPARGMFSRYEELLMHQRLDIVQLEDGRIVQIMATFDDTPEVFIMAPDVPHHAVDNKTKARLIFCVGEAMKAAINGKLFIRS